MYLELKNINKSFAGFKAARDVSLGVEKGSLTALLGPSGSGKTTVLRIIAGLEAPDSGEIILDGRSVNELPGSQRGIGFVFQNYALFRYMTVYDNIAFGLQVQKKNKKEIKERVVELMELIGLAGLEKRYPNWYRGPAPAWRCPGAWRQIPSCCCWTSPLPPSTPRCGENCGSG